MDETGEETPDTRVICVGDSGDYCFCLFTGTCVFCLDNKEKAHTKHYIVLQHENIEVCPFCHEEAMQDMFPAPSSAMIGILVLWKIYLL